MVFVVNTEQRELLILLDSQTVSIQHGHSYSLKIDNYTNVFGSAVELSEIILRDYSYVCGHVKSCNIQSMEITALG